MNEEKNSVVFSVMLILLGVLFTLAICGIAVMWKNGRREARLPDPAPISSYGEVKARQPTPPAPVPAPQPMTVITFKFEGGEITLNLATGEAKRTGKGKWSDGGKAFWTAVAAAYPEMRQRIAMDWMLEQQKGKK